MASKSTANKVRALFNKADNEQSYEPLESDASTMDDDWVVRPVLFTRDDTPEPEVEQEQDKTEEAEPFSWFEYSIFLLLGVAMLWAWYGHLFPRGKDGMANIFAGTCS